MTVVAVLGGSGRLGSRVVNLLTQRNLPIRALVHRSDLQSNRGVTCIPGGARDPRSLAELLDGATCVVSTLGNLGSPVPDVCASATSNLIPLMIARRIKRIISTTGSAARLDSEIGHEAEPLLARRTMLMKHVAPFILDAETHMRMLGASNLDWTVVRAPIMVGGSQKAQLSLEPARIDATLPYDAVARLIVDELVACKWVAEAPFAVAQRD